MTVRYVVTSQEEWRGEVMQISWSPRLFVVKGFLSDSECEHLKSLVGSPPRLHQHAPTHLDPHPCPIWSHSHPMLCCRANSVEGPPMALERGSYISSSGTAPASDMQDGHVALQRCIVAVSEQACFSTFRGPAKHPYTWPMHKPPPPPWRSPPLPGNLAPHAVKKHGQAPTGSTP